MRAGESIRLLCLPGRCNRAEFLTREDKRGRGRLPKAICDMVSLFTS